MVSLNLDDLLMRQFYWNLFRQIDAVNKIYVAFKLLVCHVKRQCRAENYEDISMDWMKEIDGWLFGLEFERKS